jgi:hypothetical protein
MVCCHRIDVGGGGPVNLTRGEGVCRRELLTERPRDERTRLFARSSDLAGERVHGLMEMKLAGVPLGRVVKSRLTVAVNVNTRTTRKTKTSRLSCSSKNWESPQRLVSPVRSTKGAGNGHVTGNHRPATDNGLPQKEIFSAPLQAWDAAALVGPVRNCLPTIAHKPSLL